MNRISPESEMNSSVCSIECFQNYTAPEVFIQGIAGEIRQQDVISIVKIQKQMLQRFEKTNEMLQNCNALSASRLQNASSEFKKHTQGLQDMKKDLDFIFKKVRFLKAKIQQQHPGAFYESTETIEEAGKTRSSGSSDAESPIASPESSDS